MNELNDLRTRGVETRCQMKKVGISDEEAHREKENEKAKVETWNRTQKEMSDEEAHREKEAEKAEVETWDQTEKDSEKEMSDKEAHYEKETEKVKKDEVGTWSQMQEKLPPPEAAKEKPSSSRQSSQQTKLVQRYSCDVCKHVSKTIEQLKKHLAIAHKGHRNTTWMFCGDCEYATRMEEEMISHFLKKVAEKERIETWGQTQKGIEKEMSDEESRCNKEAEKAKEGEKKKEDERQEMLEEVHQAIKDAEGSEASEVSAEETDLTTPTSMPKKVEKKKKIKKANHSESSDKGYMELTPQARNKVTTLEEGITYAEHRTNVDWETPKHAVDHDVNKQEDWDNEFDDPKHNPADSEGCAKYEENYKSGFDRWQVKSGTISDKLNITENPAKIKKAGKELRAVTKKAEKKTKDEQKEENKKKADEGARKGEDDESVHDMDENEEDDTPGDDNEETDTGHSTPDPVECATPIRGLKRTDTQEGAKEGEDDESVHDMDENEEDDIPGDDNEEADGPDKGQLAPAPGECATPIRGLVRWFDVNELVCDLVEAIQYETLEETYQVQRCFTGKDRVCDTTYKIDMTTKDDYQCTNVETPNCYMECATPIRGLKRTDTQVHTIASRLGIRAVDREEQTVEGIKASTDLSSVLAEASESEKTKEVENVSTAEDAPGCKLREEVDKKDEAPDAGTYREKETTFLFQVTSGDANATQFLDKNWMVGGADDSHTTSCLCLYEYDRYDTTNNNETSRKGRERVDQFTYEKYRQAGTMKAQAIEKNPVQFSLKRWYSLTHYNKGEDSDTIYKMFKDKNEEEMAILDTGCAGAAAGRKWVEDHIENLCPEDKTAVRRREGRQYFKFGSGMRYKSQQRMVLPVYFAERRALMAIDMIDLHLPLLISLPAMKKAKTVIYTATDTATMYGQHLKLGKSNGHYTLSLRKGGAKRVAEESTDEENSSTDEEDLENLMEEDPENLMVEVYVELGGWKEEVTKVHSQMCHASEEMTKSKLEESSMMRQARDEDHMKGREEDEQKLEKKADIVNQENGKQDEDELRGKEDEITRGRVRRNSTGGAGAGFSETSPAENVEKHPADGVVVDIDIAKGIRLDTERMIKQAAWEKPNDHHKLRDTVNQENDKQDEDEVRREENETTRERIRRNLTGSAGAGFDETSPAENVEKNPAGGVMMDIDAAKGIRLNTERMTKQAVGEKPNAGHKLRDMVGEVNELPSLYSESGEYTIPFLERNGCGASSQYGACPTQKSPSQVYSDTYGEVNGLELTSTTGKRAKKALHGVVRRNLVDFNLEQLHELFAQVGGNGNKSLPRLCEQLGIRLKKNEMMLGNSSSSFLGDLSGSASMYGEHLPSPVENAKQKGGRLMVHANRQYTTEDTTYMYQLWERFMSGATSDEKDSRYRKVGRLWVYEARCRMDDTQDGMIRTNEINSFTFPAEGDGRYNQCWTNVGPEEHNREKSSNSFIILAKEHKHSFEPKMIYELEMKTCPKKTKKDSHTKNYKEQPRVTSNQCDIQPLCDTQERMIHIYETNSSTLSTKKQIHRFEPKMIYELEMKTRPKKIKKDDYIKDCKEQPRVISDQCDIRPLSDTQERMVRIYETNSSILSARKQIYRSEPKMIYELERKTHPKKTKKDDCIKDCKEQPRVICDRCDIQPGYDTQERMVRADETNRK